MIKQKPKNDHKKPRTRRQVLVFCVVIACLALSASAWLGLYIWNWEHREHVLEVHTLLVDGNIVLFIRTPDNRTVLVDSGKTDSIIRVLTSLMPFYRRTIDTVILTKDDDSHATGLVDVINRYHVGQVVEMSSSSSSSGSYLAFERVISEKNIPDRRIGAGESFSLGDAEILADAFFPIASETGTGFKYSKTNVPSLAFIVQYGTTSFVLSDLTKPEQKYISSSTIAFSVLASSSVVYISQHAGGTAAVDEGFYERLHPAYAVIAKKPSPPPRQAKAPDPSKKPAKPKKPAFNISDVVGEPIINLFERGDAVFISDGNSVSVTMAEK